MSFVIHLHSGFIVFCKQVLHDWHMSFPLNVLQATCNGRCICCMMTSSNKTIFRLLALCAENSPVTGEFPSNGQWRGALMFWSAWINGWVNNREAGDLKRHRAHYDVDVTCYWCAQWGTTVNILNNCIFALIDRQISILKCAFRFPTILFTDLKKTEDNKTIRTIYWCCIHISEIVTALAMGLQSNMVELKCYLTC